MATKLTPALREALIKEYGEVSSNFRTLTDIRFRLLAFLPAASAAAIAFENKGSEPASLAFGVFGLAVTVGLLIYNTRNNQLYNDLVGRAAEIERTLGLHGGAFAHRPRSWLKIGLPGFGIEVNHGNGVALIYAATCALWLFEVLWAVLKAGPTKLFDALKGIASFQLKNETWAVALAAVLAIIAVGLVWFLINRQIERQEKVMHAYVRLAMSSIENVDLAKTPDDADFIGYCLAISGKKDKDVKKLEPPSKLIDREKLATKARFYASLPPEQRAFFMPAEPDVDSKAQLVALLTDMSPRSIRDVFKGRSG
jgi:hypothetical protein